VHRADMTCLHKPTCQVALSSSTSQYATVPHLVRLPHAQLLHVDNLPAVACTEVGNSQAGTQAWSRAGRDDAHHRALCKAGATPNSYAMRARMFIMLPEVGRYVSRV
jgi:hypothetical protein